MKHSERRILTTHVGSLPRPRELLQPLHAKDSGDAYDAAELERRVAGTVSGVVRRQMALGLDVINDGEHGRASFATYAHVDKDKFRWLGGERTIRRYESAPGSFRSFSSDTSPVLMACCVKQSFSSAEPSIHTMWSGLHIRAISSTHS